jgi:hypothetical protein
MIQKDKVKICITDKILKFDNLPILLLMLAVLPLPYAYYQIMRWIVCGFAIQIILNHSKINNWKALFCLIAIIYNPINPIHLEKTIWMVVNTISAIIWIAYEKLKNS